MLLGMLPLMVATGAGANGSRSLASCVVGGMVLGIPAFPRARPVHHLPVVARTADAKENGGVIEVNYS